MNAKEIIQQIDKELSRVTTGNLNHRVPNIRMMLQALEIQIHIEHKNHGKDKTNSDAT